MSIHSPLARQHDARACDQATFAAAGNSHTERTEISHGLLGDPARVSPKYLYDTLGSKLFETLCLLPEYYPTRTEAAIFQAHRRDIARAVGPGAVLIDLGAGNCAKAERLFGVLAPCHYVAVDISAEFLQDALASLQPRHPQISMTALGQDFSQGLHLPSDVPADNRLFFYPGSSLGNFSPEEAQRFLRGLRISGGPQASLLLGVDLVKESKLLNAAYDDALGLTAAFNLNLLRNLNHLLDADFDVRDWAHIAFFNEQKSRVEMHVQARHAVQVRWPGASRLFAEGERIHTESSYKYTPASLAALLESAGWQQTDFWTDPDGWFAVVHARTQAHDKGITQ